MNTRRQYERFYKKKTHVKILRAQMLQQKIRADNINQAMDEIKVSFTEMVVVLTLSLKENIKEGGNR